MRCKAQSAVMPIGIASICNAAVRPYRADSTDLISVIQWTSAGNATVRGCFGGRSSAVLACTQPTTSTPIMSTTMTIRLEDDVKERLDRLAESTNRSKSFLAAEAVREFVDINEWQVAEVRAALKEAEAGEFATDAQVAAIAEKWKLSAR